MNLLNRKKELHTELQRRSGIKRSMLRMFQEEGHINTQQMLRHFGSGHSTRRTELKKEGYVIDSVYIKPGLWDYVFRGRENDLPDNWDEIKAQASEDDKTQLIAND